MSLAEVLAVIEILPDAERMQVAQETLRRLNTDDLKIIERTLRRLTHPDVPASFWDAAEEMEDGGGMEMEIALAEEPPQEILRHLKD